MYALAQQYPADFELGRRASAVHRSLAAFDPRNTEVAVKIEENLYLADPGNRDTLARIGDVLADRELFDRAAPYWQRMAQIRPGEPQAYLDAATIYWDYYDFDSALKLLDEGRARLGDPSLYAYEAGAIYEGKREFPQAIAEYIKGALKQHEGSRPYNRLLDLARRKSLRDEAERATASLTEGASPGIDAIKLRVAVLETQNRPKDVEQLWPQSASAPVRWKSWSGWRRRRARSRWRRCRREFWRSRPPSPRTRCANLSCAIRWFISTKRRRS